MPNEPTEKAASLHVDTHRQSNTGLTRSCVMAGKETRVKTRMKTGVKILSAIRANNMITREELAQSLEMTITARKVADLEKAIEGDRHASQFLYALIRETGDALVEAVENALALPK